MSLLDKIKNLHDKLGISFGDIQLVLGFLSKYGYLAKLGINLDTATIQQILQALQLFHQFHALTMPEDDTELVSPKVINLMGQHRCGVADFMSRTQGKWAATELTYYIGSRDSDMSAQEWDEVIENAFGNWTKVTPLKFKKASSQSSANFVLNIGQGQRDGFDGPSGILAYFELPPIVNFQGQLSGMIDASETWLKTGDSNGRGIYLENVVTHELGHGLGLEHSTIQAALMAPYYNANIRIPQNVDDIPRIQSIYGKPIPTPTPTPVPTPSPTPTPVPTPTPQPTPGKAGQIIINIEGKVTGVSIPGYRSLPI